MRVSVHTVPRSSRNSIDGVLNGALRIRVSAAPVNGAANDAVIDVLASTLRVPRSAIEIARGHRSRNKVVAIRGVSVEQVRGLGT